MSKLVTITHPQLGRSRVYDTSLRVWLERGWTLLEPGGSAPAPPPSATPENSADDAESDVTASRDLELDS